MFSIQIGIIFGWIGSIGQLRQILSKLSFEESCIVDLATSRWTTDTTKEKHLTS